MRQWGTLASLSALAAARSRPATVTALPRRPRLGHLVGLLTARLMSRIACTGM